jgi:hypothetical protein
MGPTRAAPTWAHCLIQYYWASLTHNEQIFDAKVQKKHTFGIFLILFFMVLKINRVYFFSLQKRLYG